MATEPPVRPLPATALVTGGSGFVGSHVVRRLVDSGVAVRCLLGPRELALSLEGVDCERVEGDVEDRAALARAIEGCDAVFHVAAAAGAAAPTREGRQRLFELHVDGTVNVMEAALAAGVARVVHTSSSETVGEAAGRGSSDETTRFNRWATAGDSVMSRYIGELEVLTYAARGLEVVVVNVAAALGANDRAPTPVGRWVADTLAGRLPCVVDGGVNVVAAADVAQGHLLAATRGVSGERYILGGHNLTFRQLVEEVAALAGRRGPRVELPTRVARAWGWVSERWADRVGGAEQAAALRSGAGRYAWVSSAKAQRDLGYSPSPLSEALGASVDWFRRYPV